MVLFLGLILIFVPIGLPGYNLRCCCEEMKRERHMDRVRISRKRIPLNQFLPEMAVATTSSLIVDNDGDTKVQQLH